MVHNLILKLASRNCQFKMWQNCDATLQNKLFTFRQKQLPRGVLRKSFYENMQQIYRRTPMPKCNFNKVVVWVFSCKFATYFRKTFYQEHLWTAASVQTFSLQPLKNQTPQPTWWLSSLSQSQFVKHIWMSASTYKALPMEYTSIEH